MQIHLHLLSTIHKPIYYPGITSAGYTKGIKKLFLNLKLRRSQEMQCLVIEVEKLVIQL